MHEVKSPEENSSGNFELMRVGGIALSSFVKYLQNCRHIADKESIGIAEKKRVHIAGGKKHFQTLN
jgi:hypothetical protein